MLFCIYIINKGLLALEVEFDGVGIIGIATHLEDRFALDASLRRTVGCTHRLHVALVHIHGDAVGTEVHVGILHIGVSVEICHLVLGIVYERVVRLIVNRCVYSTLFLPGDTVEADTVIHHFIMFPYSFLQRVHLRGVVSLFQFGIYFVAQRVYEHTVTHAVHGFRLLRFLLFLFRIGRTWVSHHHTRDGSEQQHSYRRLFSHSIN